MNELPVEVAQFDDIGVDDVEAADPGRREVGEDGGTETARADDDDVRVDESFLCLGTESARRIWRV